MISHKKRILLIGHDPVFAWALQQRVNPLGWKMEHVYTVTEARMRADRFHYDAFLLDGLNEHELAKFPHDSIQSSIFVLEDSAAEDWPQTPWPRTLYLTKEDALKSVVSNLQSLS